MKRILFFLLIIQSTTHTYAHPHEHEDPTQKRLFALEKKYDSILHVLDVESKIQSTFQSGLAKDSQQESNLAKSVTDFEVKSRHSSLLSQIGTIILLFGMFIEVIGATLLAGANLSDEILQIRSARVLYSAGDLVLADKVKGNVMVFYGILGSVLLVIGFCVQFTGTIIVLGIHWYTALGLILSSVLSSLALLIFLASQNTSQSLKEKKKVFLRNLQRLFVYPIRNWLANNTEVVCEVCHKKMPYSKAEVWYKQNFPADQYPYLYPPYGFYMGHKSCLTEIYPVDEEIKSSLTPPHPLYKATAVDFYNQSLDKLCDWNERRVSDLQQKRPPNKKIVGETEVSLKLLKKLLRKKHV